MKRCLSILLFSMFALLLNVKADEVDINSIQLVDKTTSSRVISEPTISNLSIDFNLEFNQVGDYALYKINITNNLSNNLYFYTDDILNEKIKYEYYFNDSNNYINPSQSEELFVKISYLEELASSDYNEENIYNSTSNKIYLLTETEEDPRHTTTTAKTTTTSTTTTKTTNQYSDTTTNLILPTDNHTKYVVNSPQTGDISQEYIVLFTIAFVLLIDILYFTIFKHKTKKLNIIMSSISVLLILASILYKKTYAFEDSTFEINAKIEIPRYPEMAESCEIADSQRTGTNCIDWAKTKETVGELSWYKYNNNNEGFGPHYEDTRIDLSITTTEIMSETYSHNGIEYTLQKTFDISKWNNGLVTLGIYKNVDNNYLYLIGGKGGVKAPKNSSYLFAAKVGVGSGLVWCYGNSLTNINAANFHNFDTSHVTNMSHMFEDFAYASKSFNFDISTFDTRNVTDMSHMFQFINGINSGNKLDLDINSFDTSKVVDMSYMFAGKNIGEYGGMAQSLYSSSIKKIYVSDKWNTSHVKNSNAMFSGCSNLVGGSGTIFDSSHIDKEYARVDNPPNELGYFTLKTN